MIIRFAKEWPLHLLLIPGVIIAIIFSYIPMAGVLIAFERYIPTRGIFGSPWVGWDNFKYMIENPDMKRIMFNTLYIAFMKIVGGLLVPITISILLNEIRREVFKRIFQTLVYLPHFLSWVLLGGILIDILSPSTGIVNQFLGWFGMDPIFFLANNSWFPYTLVISDIWKEFGFSTIIYLAALTSINPSLYEAAEMDGANRWKQTWHITLPGMMPIIVLMATLSVGSILNAGFEQVFNLYSPPVYESGDIIDTFVYRMGFEQVQYGLATAVGLLKSVISLVLIALSYSMAYRFAGYRIF
ncbi:ABC transporter permease [Paenibacillus eucommiae]|uniref:Aldouronate transport system permease protein n=1 Tax=Paenibacillus eucommiae TaxID=1355755 RepID=A0ABS4IMD1_9BACL|nr:ABC transporter permease subunit [Paenibacillus eucommiae]MBP1988731.1 putative aldouronate transport system permease protein [Paenibacillus eucommiae]